MGQVCMSRILNLVYYIFSILTPHSWTLVYYAGIFSAFSHCTN